MLTSCWAAAAAAASWDATGGGGGSCGSGFQPGGARSRNLRMKEGNHIFFLFSIFSRIELAQERPTISAKNSSDTFTFIVIPGSVLNGNDISLIITNKSQI